jgi:hypothetical protein
MPQDTFVMIWLPFRGMHPGATRIFPTRWIATQMARS